MSDPVVSFQDFKWACGHVGPAVCQQCWQKKLDEIEELKKKHVESCQGYHEIQRKMQAEIEQLRRRNARGHAGRRPR